MDRMPDSGSGDGGSSPLVVTNKTKSRALEEGAASPLVFLHCFLVFSGFLFFKAEVLGKGVSQSMDTS
jgi:hypothetical protein